MDTDKPEWREPNGFIDKMAAELGTNGLYDLLPTADLTIPVLRRHVEMRRQRTLEAIKRGLNDDPDEPSALVERLAQSVLDELEQMWREDEAFS